MARPTGEGGGARLKGEERFDVIDSNEVRGSERVSYLRS